MLLPVQTTDPWFFYPYHCGAAHRLKWSINLRLEDVDEIEANDEAAAMKRMAFGASLVAQLCALVA